MREAIRTGLTAEAAVRRVQEETRAAHGAGRRPLSARAAARPRRARRPAAGPPDRARLLHDPATLPDEFILVARSLGPAELLDYDRARLRGVVLEEGSPTAHVAIVARALDIPMVGRVRDAMSRIEPGDRLALDGDHGQIFVRAGRRRRAGVRALARQARRARAGATRRCATSRR